MGFWALAAPALISAGGSILSGLLSKKPSIDPSVKLAQDLSNQATQKRLGYLTQMEQGLNRGQLLYQDTGKVLRMFLPGVGGSMEKFNSSMDALLNSADFGLARDNTLLTTLAQLSQAQGAPASVQSGANRQYQDSKSTAGNLAKMFSDLGSAAWEQYGVGKDGGAADAIVNQNQLDNMEITGGNGPVLDLTTLIKSMED